MRGVVRRPMLRGLLAAALLSGGLAAVDAAATPTGGRSAPGPRPFGLACHQAEGVRYCPGDLAHRVPTFDGVPLDVNVVLPPAPAHRPDGGYPLVVELHGW